MLDIWWEYSLDIEKQCCESRSVRIHIILLKIRIRNFLMETDLDPSHYHGIFGHSPSRHSYI
jgi:hypothetical protein